METLTLKLADHPITLTAKALARAILETHDGAPTPSRVDASLPAFIATVDGEKYAGITIYEDKPAHLFLLPGDMDDAKWADAVTWAKKQGGDLPTRFDLLVLFKNLKSEFKPECYWSGEEPAGDSAYAWYQYFNDGGQDTWRKDYEFRARAVRRVPI